MTGRGSTTSARAIEMRRVLERWEQSGLTLKEFGRRERIAAPTLGWWRHVLRRRNTGEQARSRTQSVRASTSRATKPEFVELKVAAEPVTPTAAVILEVVLRSGQVVRVPPGFEISALRAVVAALEERC